MQPIDIHTVPAGAAGAAAAAQHRERSATATPQSFLSCLDRAAQHRDDMPGVQVAFKSERLICSARGHPSSMIRRASTPVSSVMKLISSDLQQQTNSADHGGHAWHTWQHCGTTQHHIYSAPPWPACPETAENKRTLAATSGSTALSISSAKAPKAHWWLVELECKN